MHVVPHDVSGAEGVGRYAWHLAETLERNHGAHSRFLICAARGSLPQPADARSIYLPQRGNATLVEGMRLAEQSLSGNVPHRTQLLLHYSGYGYSVDGAPLWMVEALRGLQAARPDIALAVFFHELYASSLPWRRAFWHSRRQRAAAAALLEISDWAFCTTRLNARRLCAWHPKTPLTTVAIPSTIGEPAAPPSFAARESKMVIFGGEANRVRSYRHGKRAIQLAARALDIDTVLDIGPGRPEFPTIENVEFRRLGLLDERAISEQLLLARAGFLSYFPGHLAKSTIFAAYCCHGVVPIMPACAHSDDDGIVNGKHYIVPSNNPHISLRTAEDASVRAREWYLGHTLEVHAQALAETW